MAAATTTDVNAVLVEVNGDNVVRALPRPQLLPTFVGGWMPNAAVNAVLSLASWGGACRNATEPPRIGGELSFFTPRPRYSFSARKKCGTQPKIKKCPRKNNLRFVGRPKLPMWIFPLLEVRLLPPNQSNGVHDCLAPCWNQYNCLRPDLLFPVGKVGMKWFCSKSLSSQEKKYTQVVHCTFRWRCCPCNNTATCRCLCHH